MKEFREKTELFISRAERKEDDMEAKGASAKDLQQLGFKVNAIHSEMDVMMKTFSTHKLKQIDDHDNQIQMLQYEVELMKINFENTALKTHVDDIKILLDKYAYRDSVDELRQDL